MRTCYQRVLQGCFLPHASAHTVLPCNILEAKLPSSFETTFYLYNKYLVEATPRLTLVATPWSCIERVCRSGPSPIRKGHAVRHTPGHLTTSSAIAHHDQVLSGTVGRQDRCGGGYGGECIHESVFTHTTCQRNQTPPCTGVQIRMEQGSTTCYTSQTHTGRTIIIIA